MAHGVPREDIDRPALRPDPEGRFRNGRPAGDLESSDHCVHEMRVIAVEQAIEVLALPHDAQGQAGTQMVGNAAQRSHRETVGPATLDPRDGGVRQASASPELILGPVAPSPKCAKRESEAD